MKMHWCTGKINLSGQGFMIVDVGAHEPISWPEAQVLMALHGDENVYELKPCAIARRSAVDEKSDDCSASTAASLREFSLVALRAWRWRCPASRRRSRSR